MTISLYQKYLLLDMIDRRATALGQKLDNASFSSEHWDGPGHFRTTQDKAYSFLHQASGSIAGLARGEAVETFAEKWLTAYPDTELVRLKGRVYLRGETHLGLHWFIEVGTGVCERVQVGTRKVMKIDPKFLVDAPMIEDWEPVFEIQCGDPLRELVNA